MHGTQSIFLGATADVARSGKKILYHLACEKGVVAVVDMMLLFYSTYGIWGGWVGVAFFQASSVSGWTTRRPGQADKLCSSGLRGINGPWCCTTSVCCQVLKPWESLRPGTYSAQCSKIWGWSRRGRHTYSRDSIVGQRAVHCTACAVLQLCMLVLARTTVFPVITYSCVYV